MWQIFVDFRSASSEIRRRKKKKKEEESVVKYKSAEMYVGRPNDNNIWLDMLYFTVIHQYLKSNVYLEY